MQKSGTFKVLVHFSGFKKNNFPGQKENLKISVAIAKTEQMVCLAITHNFSKKITKCALKAIYFLLKVYQIFSQSLYVLHTGKSFTDTAFKKLIYSKSKFYPEIIFFF